MISYGFTGHERALHRTCAGPHDLDQPLVTVIVRSMDRPELGHALASIEKQDYPAVETIVVDATGGRHSPLRPHVWKAGHSIRIVASGQPLKRPQAGNLGLESATGEWFTFLDDDDTCEPSHLSALVAAARDNPETLVVYGRGRLFNAAGALDRVFGYHFNRALMHFGPLFYWQAALIRTRVRDLGCRFDPAFEVCEDRDFLAQIAEHGDFTFVPDLATFNYRPDLGTSGTGNGANRDYARMAKFDNQLRAKWAGQGVYHNERAAVLCRQGVRAFLAGEVDAASRAFERALELYPDDPNAMHGKARVAIARGNRVLAERCARAAVEINPMAAEYRATLTEICGPDPSAGGRTPTLSRMAACLCGSGRRYKACCGRLNAGPAPVAAPADASVEMMCQKAQLALDRGDAPAAFEALKRAASIRCDGTVGWLLETCCKRLAEDQARASLWSMAHRLRDVSAAATPGCAPRHVLIVGPATEAIDKALEAARSAAGVDPDADFVTAHAVDDASIGIDSETCVVFLRPDDVPAHGVAGPCPGRVAILMPRDDPAALVCSFARIADGWPNARLEFYRTSNLNE